MEQSDPQTPRSNKGLHITYLSIIFVLTGISGFLGWKFMEKQDQIQTQTVVVTELTNKNDNLSDELEDLSKQFEDLKTNDANLQKELQDKIAQIEEMKKEAERNKNNAAVISKLRKEMGTLRGVMQSYVRTIDSMARINDGLRAEGKQVRQELSAERDRSTELVRQTENLQGQLNNAARIAATNIVVSGIAEKRGGRKASTVDKASKIDKLAVTFELVRNPTTKPGMKDIYVRIITPDGQELTQALDAEHRITYNGGTTYFAARKSVDYQNENLSVLINCPKPNADYTFLPGEYIVELISDKAKIGGTRKIFQ
ncbi:MAG: hypothetical protein MUC87_09675 [Bacteroidia bacterium]|jgi:uncharacterized phage infection (PIP) family protein YhgE|nr:hypothetical protein [Bacteroidia bacterium]